MGSGEGLELNEVEENAALMEMMWVLWGELG